MGWGGGVCVCVCVSLSLLTLPPRENGCFQPFKMSNIAYDFDDLVIFHILDVAGVLYYCVYLWY